MYNKLLAICLITQLSITRQLYGEADMAVTKVIIPAAGIGTRLLPFSKAVPKELAPIMGIPALHYIIEEAIASNIFEFVLITSKQKTAIEKYFTVDPELSATLKKHNKYHLLQGLDQLCEQINIEYVNQDNPLGLGHAVSLAKEHITSEHFGIMLPDDIMDGDIAALKQLIEVAQEFNASVIAVQEVPKEKVSSYGVIKYSEQMGENLYRIEALVEKPAQNQAPSNLAIVGRYVLSKDIFTSLDNIKPGAGGEYQLTDAIADMIARGQTVLAYKLDAKRFDTGNPEGLLEATLHYAQK